MHRRQGRRIFIFIIGPSVLKGAGRDNRQVKCGVTILSLRIDTEWSMTILSKTKDKGLLGDDQRINSSMS